MKGCLKIILYGFLGLVVLGGLITLFGPKDEKKKATDTEEATGKKDDTDDNDSPTEEIKSEPTYDLSKSKILTEILINFDSCYYWATAMKSQDGEGLENAKRQGNIYYNRAYQKYLDLQKEANYDLPRNKSEVISKAMTFYSEIFNNKYASVSNYETELSFIKKNLTGFPDNESQIEKDFTEGIYRVIIGSGTKMEIGLPKKGTWCLTDIEGSDKVLLEGDFPNNGYGKFDIVKSQLPIYLGDTKTMTVDNVGIRTDDMQLIFKRCEKN
jgi:hypothetical protein